MPLITKWVKRAVVILLVSGAFLLLLIGAVRHPLSSLSLNIYGVEQNINQLLYSKKVTAGESVILSYTHSSDGTPVKHLFTVSEVGALVLLEERYLWYGAGLEFSSKYHLAYEDGWVSITGYDRSFEYLPIRIALTVPQLLIVADHEICLSDLAEPGSSLVIKVESPSLFKQSRN